MSPRLVDAAADLAHRWSMRMHDARFLVEHLDEAQLIGAARLVVLNGWSAERAVSWMRACWKLGVEASSV